MRGFNCFSSRWLHAIVNSRSRENIMKQAASLKGYTPPMLLPGITVNTSATDFYPIQSVQLARVKGASFELFGKVIASESE